MSERERLTVREAAERVRVCRRTMWTWIKREKVETCRTAGGSLRIYADSLWQDSPPEPPGPRSA